MQTLLWLSNDQNPLEDNRLNYSPIGKDVFIVWLKSYDEFVEYLDRPYPMPDGVCFNYDLGEEKTGYDAAKYLIHMCVNMKLKLPKCSVYSDNPIGRKKIETLLENFLTHH